MKRIGLLGGMSWESTAEYYRLINELVAEQLGGLHSADCLLRSVDFAEIEVAPARGPVVRGRRAARARGAAARGRRRGAARPVHEHDAQGRGGDRARDHDPVRPHRRHDRRGRARRRPGARRPARDRLHDGAGLLRRPAAHGAQPGRARARAGRPQDRPRRDLRRAVPRRHQGRLARRVPPHHRRHWSSAARRPSCSAAPRSTCSSARRTRPCRSTTRRACTPSARSSSACCPELPLRAPDRLRARLLAASQRPGRRRVAPERAERGGPRG